MTITECLFELRDEENADFQCRLTPGISRESCIGVRVPLLRKLAKKLLRESEQETKLFLRALPHQYFDEDMLHALLLSENAEFDSCVEEIEEFLLFINNWAVCDTLSPRVFKQNRQRLMPKIVEWIRSGKVYMVRFGIEMLMKHFLDEDYQPAYLELPAEVRSEDYYVRMMQAWFFSTALAKQWKDALFYLEEKRLDPWTHNKTIQKARESFCISKERKDYLKQLKRQEYAEMKQETEKSDDL